MGKDTYFQFQLDIIHWLIEKHATVGEKTGLPGIIQVKLIS